jgi:hypothetical protein
MNYSYAGSNGQQSNVSALIPDPQVLVSSSVDRFKEKAREIRLWKLLGSIIYPNFLALIPVILWKLGFSFAFGSPSSCTLIIEGYNTAFTNFYTWENFILLLFCVIICGLSNCSVLTGLFKIFKL